MEGSHHRPLSRPHPHAAVTAVFSIQRPQQGTDRSASNQVHGDAGLTESSDYPHLGTAPSQRGGGGYTGELHQQMVFCHRPPDRRVMLPGSSSSQDQGDGVAGEDPRQAGEVRVSVCWFVKHTLVQFHLEGKTETDGGGGVKHR